MIAFQRLLGNQAPDTDPGASSSTPGVLRVGASSAPPVWSGPIVCAPRTRWRLSHPNTPKRLPDE